MRKFELYFKNYLIGNIEMNDNWVYSGTSGTDDAKEIFE